MRTTLLAPLLALTVACTSPTTNDPDTTTRTPDITATTPDNSDSSDSSDRTFTTTIRRIIDGDTVELADGTRARLLGIDTPEIGRNGAPSDCYADEATRELRQLIPTDGRVTLTLDRDPRDRYQRLLVWMWNGTTLINTELVARGAATTMIIPPNTTYRTELETAQQHAITNGLGLWTNC